MFPQPRTGAFQTKTVLRRMLDEAGISPRGRLGQHFLIDRNLMRKLIEAAELGPADCVIEVGAGTGGLTAILAEAAGCVVAVEIDRELARLAAGHLSELQNVTLIHGDALENKSTLSRDLAAAVRRAHAETDGRLKMVANLPYDIATPLVVNLLLGDPAFDRLCFTVQAEVADRFLARPDTADYGPVSIVTQALATGRRICKVPPQAFWPVPKVDSAMIRLDVRPRCEIPIGDPPGFAGFVRSFFQHRRKTIAHTARHMDNTPEILAAAARVGIHPQARPQELAVRDWLDLYQAAR